MQNAAQINDLFEKLHKNKLFEFFVITIIVLSAVLIGVRTYDLPANFISTLIYLDWGITLFFLVELTIRFFASERKLHFFKSGWNIFDTLIVTVSLVPIDNSEMAVIGRLIRVFRVLRMVSIIPELRLLLNSLITALPRLGYVVLLMFIIFYIFAAIGSTLFNEINPTLWGDIAISMLTLFRVMTFEDWTDVMYETMAVYGWSWAYYIIFIFLTAFAFLNMVIGVVVTVLDEETQKENARNSALKNPVSPEDNNATLADITQQLAAIQQRLMTLQNVK